MVLVLIHLAKVPAKHVAKAAAAFVRKLGRSQSDLLTRSLAQASGSGHEQQTAQNALKNSNLKVDVRISTMSAPCLGLAVCYATDWVSEMSKCRQLNRLYGGLSDTDVKPNLACFWDMFRKLRPEHEIFDMFDKGEADPMTTIPCQAHVDEGRGNKPTGGILVVSTAGLLGKGTNKQRTSNPGPFGGKLGLNYIGLTLSLRMTHVAVPKTFYESDQDKYHGIMSHICMDARRLLDEGFEHNKETWRLCYVAVPADWVAHCKNGNLKRSFYHAVKQVAVVKDVARENNARKLEAA